MSRVLARAVLLLAAIVLSSSSALAASPLKQVEELPINTQLQMSIASFATVNYTFRTTDAGAYTISLRYQGSNIGAEISLGRYTIINCDRYEDITDEACTVELKANALYELSVQEYDDVESYYTLLIQKD